MRVLHHYQLSASARFIRLVLAERGLVFLPKIEIDTLSDVATLIINKVSRVNKVLYDITSKPPSTIEWE